MPKTFKRITNEALSLPRASRARLLDRLLESLRSKKRREIDEAWVDEVKRRMHELETGKVKSIPGEKVLREARRRFK